jgi:ribosomal protein L11 methyltransferase
MKTWKNITLDFPGMDLRHVSDLLSILEVVSVTIKDKQKESDSNWVDDPDNPNPLSGDTHVIVLMIQGNQDVDLLIYEIQMIMNLDNAPDYVEEIFKDKDWVTYTQSQFKEIFISDSLRIVPPWESNSEFSGQSIIIQPGSGFGTGTHPTTQLCLRWLENNLKENNTVLDYGCGSGVLSIGAKILGAGFVEGVEIDSNAILNAEQNNELNNLMIPYHHPNSFESNEKYDIVIANILAAILIRLAPTLGPFIGHKLILSGILENQVQDIIQSYSEWVSLSVQNEMDGWVLLAGQL